MVFSIFVLGIAVSLYRISNLGADPFTTMNMGISGLLHIPFGVNQLIMNVGLFIFVWIFAKRFIGVGTFVNMVSIGFIADFIVYLYDMFFSGSIPLMVRLMILMFAVLISSIAIALYISAGLGIAPYDALPFIISKATNGKIPFSHGRILTDVTCVLIGFSFSATVGIGTLITAFFIGPLVQYFRNQLKLPASTVSAE